MAVLWPHSRAVVSCKRGNSMVRVDGLSTKPIEKLQVYHLVRLCLGPLPAPWHPPWAALRPASALSRVSFLSCRSAVSKASPAPTIY